MRFNVTKVLALVLVTLIFAMGAAFAADPAKAQQYLTYGHQYLKAKQYDNAIKYYQYSAKLNPTADAYYYTGYAYFYKGDKTQALRYAQYALKINPSHANSQKLIAAAGGAAGGGAAPAGGGDKYLNAGMQYLKAKQFDKAIQYFNASIQMRPTAEGYMYLGTAYYYKGDMANAKAAYQKSLELNPNNAQVRQVIAKIDQQGGGAGGEQRISQQMGVHPLLLAVLFAGAIAALFVF